MIRRDVQDGYRLFRQDDHARLSGEFARHLGNEHIARPDPFAPFVAGCAAHDDGWRLHDDCPTLDPACRPLDVFDTPPPLAFELWLASTQDAARLHPWAAMLVRLHVLHLSGMAISATPPATPRFNLADRQVHFLVNRFQQAQIEQLEHLRRAVGMRTDVATRLGLADGSDDPAEQELTYHLRWLQAMDALSLAACCTDVPFPRTTATRTTPNGPAVVVTFLRPDAHRLVVTPWIFNRPSLRASVPYRHVPEDATRNLEAFRGAYSAAEPQRLELEVAPS